MKLLLDTHAVIWCVITSYSIHYTKLYDLVMYWYTPASLSALMMSSESVV